MSEYKYKSKEGREWTAAKWSYTGGHKDIPAEHTADLWIEDRGSYYGCSHDIELTRKDLLALLEILGKAEADYQKEQA